MWRVISRFGKSPWMCGYRRAILASAGRKADGYDRNSIKRTKLSFLAGFRRRCHSRELRAGIRSIQPLKTKCKAQ
jgi:hypothetical protein